MKYYLLPLVLILSVGCASKQTKDELRAKAENSEVSDSQSLGEKINRLIETSDSLTDVQKKEIRDIFSANKKRADELTEESFKFRSILVKKLLSGKIVRKEINFLKKEIKRIESDRLKNTFDAVEKITSIVSGRSDKEKFLNQIIYPERSSR